MLQTLLQPYYKNTQHPALEFEVIQTSKFEAQQFK